MRSQSAGRATPVRGRAGYAVLLAVLGGVLLVSMTLSVAIGTVRVPVSSVWQVTVHHLAPGWTRPPSSPIDDQIVWRFRMPRVLLAAVVGAGLSVTGTALQALVRNPLADPFVLGISAGSALGAVAVTVAGVAALDGVVQSGAAFAGALVMLVIVHLLSRSGGVLDPGRLLLTGVALSYLLLAVTSFLIFQSGSAQAARSVLFWFLGSLAAATWGQLPLPTAALVAGTVFLILQGRMLNALVSGDDTAIGLGVAPARLRRTLLVSSSLMTGVLVAVSGGIGFVGLIIPHLTRLVVGADHRRVLAASALLGAIFLEWADVLARVLVPPQELPLSVITALVGTPLFLAMMNRRSVA